MVFDGTGYAVLIFMGFINSSFPKVNSLNFKAKLVRTFSAC